MNNNNNARTGNRKRGRSNVGTSGQGNQPAKKQKTQGQQRRQRKRRAARNGRAMSQRGGAGDQSYAASAYSTEQVGKAPTVNATRETCRVTHREFIGNVSGTGSAAFVISQALALNPGLAATFPWLATIAQNWETYRFRKLRLCYYTRTGTNTVGSVIMAHDPDAADAAPSTEQVMTSYELAVEDAPWKDIMMSFSLLGLSDLGPRKFVRTGALAANLDIKTYDSGTAYVATVDSAGAAAWGKLWLEYDVEFFTPQLPPAGLPAVNGGSINSGGVVSLANPLGSIPVLDPESVGLAVDNASVITFQNPGTYVLAWDLVGTGTSGFVFTDGPGVTTTIYVNENNPAGTAMAGDGYCVVTAAGASVSVTATATTATSSNFRIGSVPPGSMA